MRLGSRHVGGAAVLWGAAGLILLGEYLLISLSFDAWTVRERGGPWALVGNAGTVAPLIVVVVTALMLLRTKPRDPGAGSEPPAAPRRLSWLVAHVLLYVAFLATTAHVFGGEAAPIGPPLLWFAVWAIVGVGVALSLLAGLVGVRVVFERLVSGSVAVALGIGALAWGAGLLSSVLWEPLSSMTLDAAAGILAVAFPQVVVDEENMILELEGFSVNIAPVCSGFEGMGLITALLGGYLIVLRSKFRFPRALLLVPIGIVAVWLGNAVRLAGLMLVGAYVDQDLAYGGFHSKAGWVYFCAITLGLATLARRSPFFARDTDYGAEAENATAAYLMPLLSVTAVALVTGMFAARADRFYGLRLVPPVVLLYLYRRYFADLARKASFVAVAAGVVVGIAWIFSEPTRAPLAPPAVSNAWIALRVVGSVVAAPVCEELAFRGYLLRRLISADFTEVSFKAWTPLALLGSSLAFGVLHERWFAASLAGAIYALVQIRSGRLLDAVVAHSVTNAIIAVKTLTTDDWSSWG